MEKIKTLVLMLALLSTQVAVAQHVGRAPFVHSGLMNMQVGLTGGVMVFNEVQDLYFNGSFAYVMESQIAVRTDLYVFLPDYFFEGQLLKNSSVLLGPEFHFPLGRFDISLLFQTGVAFPYLKAGSTDEKAQAEPVLSLGSGFYFYLFQNFHVFTAVNYLHGNYFLENTDPFRLDEIRVSAGLGINIFVNHQAAYERKNPKF